jgi:hypothetical protein
VSGDRDKGTSGERIVAERPRVPTGLRPGYLGDGSGDRLLYMLLALATECSAMREELEDLRRYLDADGERLQAFLAANPRSAAEQSAAHERREALLESMFRILREELAIEGDERFAAYLELMRNVAQP